MNGLSPKQQLFVDTYMATGNATQSAITAGYSAATAASAGSRLLKNVKVSTVLAGKQTALAKKAEITHERLRDELAKLAFINMGDFMKIDLDGKPHVDWEDLTDDQKAALTEISIDELGKADIEGNLPPVTRVKYKLADKRAAIMDLAKLCGLIPDQQQRPETTVQIAKIERVIVQHEPRKEDLGDGSPTIEGTVARRDIVAS